LERILPKRLLRRKRNLKINTTNKNNSNSHKNNSHPNSMNANVNTSQEAQAT
jgi:hypothetical protein